jgi:hypothetical protein
MKVETELETILALFGGNSVSTQAIDNSTDMMLS